MISANKLPSRKEPSQISSRPPPNKKKLQKAKVSNFNLKLITIGITQNGLPLTAPRKPPKNCTFRVTSLARRPTKRTQNGAGVVAGNIKLNFYWKTTISVQAAGSLNGWSRAVSKTKVTAWKGDRDETGKAKKSIGISGELSARYLPSWQNEGGRMGRWWGGQYFGHSVK